MNVTKTTLIAFVIAAMPPAAIAQTPDTTSTPRIDKRQANQEKRIEKGVQSGQLNKKETARLEKGQERVHKAENKAYGRRQDNQEGARPHRAHAGPAEQEYLPREARQADRKVTAACCRKSAAHDARPILCPLRFNYNSWQPNHAQGEEWIR